MKWLAWIFLSMLTGSPILSLLVLLVVWFALDRFTLGILPDPLRIFGRLRRIRHLRRTLAENPHDRRARTELADLLIGRRRHAAAAEVLRYNIENDDHEARTYFLFGVALMGSGHTERGAASLEEARTLDPKYGSGAIDLELGRGFLSAGEPAKARSHLERFVADRSGTIEGNVLLAQACAAMQEEQAAASAKEAAWADYVSSPRFVRRRERWWAWRAKPSRPLTYAALLVTAGFVLAVFVGPTLAG